MFRNNGVDMMISRKFIYWGKNCTAGRTVFEILNRLMEKRQCTFEDAFAYMVAKVTENVVEHKLYAKFSRLMRLSEDRKNGKCDVNDIVEFFTLLFELFALGTDEYDEQLKLVQEQWQFLVDLEKDDKKTCDNE